jgi:nuclear pore complex protein Nup155
VLNQGLEHLRNAKAFVSQGTTGQHLHEALRLFLSISKFITMEKLSEIMEAFKSFRFYQGVIDLSLRTASELTSLDSQIPVSEAQYEEIVDKKLKCYDFVFQSLELIEDLANPQHPSKDHITKDDAMRMKNGALTRALESNDKDFHFSLYSWYIGKNWIDQLLEIKSPFLEEYLWNNRNSLQLADYLARFYVRNNRFSDAAHLLCDVAHYPDLNLDQRLGYLTKALTNAKSASGLSTQELLSQLTDELDVARVQSDILTILKDKPNTQDDVLRLNSSLMDIGQVYFTYKVIFKICSSL